MSVYAYVQSSKIDGNVILVKNNEILKDKDIIFNTMPIVKELFELTHNQKRPTYIIKNNQHVFVNYHKEKDISNRKREFILAWATTDSKELILESAKKIDITDEFNIHKLSTYNNYKHKLIYILVFIICVILYMIFK